MFRHTARLGALVLATAALASCASKPGPGPVIASAEAAPVNGDVDAQVHNAQLLREKGDFSGAIRVLSQLMLVAPDDPRLVGEYGKVLAQQGRSAEAVEFLKRAAALDSKDWTLYSALGVAYDGANDPSDAKLAYEQALRFRPEEPAVLNNYAMSRMLAGNLGEALDLIGRARRSSTDPTIAHNAVLIASLNPPVSAPPGAKPEAVAHLAPQTPVTTQVLPPVASHPPQALVPPPVVAPVRTAEPVSPRHKEPVKPRKLAAAAKKNSGKPADQIPALRLANDRP